jgi:hypothetical protein
MRKTLCAFALTLVLSSAVWAGEIPYPAPPPPPPGGNALIIEDPTNVQDSTAQTPEETLTEYILNLLLQDILAIY